MRNLMLSTLTLPLYVLVLSCSDNLDLKGMFLPVCEDVDTRFEESMEYNDSHGYETVYVSIDDYRFYVMTDIHVDAKSDNLENYVSACISDSEAAPFSLCLGDMVNARGNQDLFFEQVEPLLENSYFFPVVGNHDLYFDQWQYYRDDWHTSTYYFEVVTPGGKKDLYIALDSASGKLGTKQRKWLEALLKDKNNGEYRHKIVFTHTHFFKKDESQGHTSNFNIEETYDLMSLFAEYGVDLVLQGHAHHRDLTVFKGVSYLRLDAMEDHYSNAFYTVIKMGESFGYEFVPVGKQEPENKN